MFQGPRLPLVLTMVVGVLGFSGCGSSATQTPASSTELNYGENKIPPADKVISKPGKGSPTTGRPPLKR